MIILDRNWTTNGLPSKNKSSIQINGKDNGTSPYGHLTSKVTSPLRSPILSPKLYSAVQFNPL